MALYWTSGGDTSPAAADSHWSLIGDLELRIRTTSDDRPEDSDPSSSDVDPPTCEGISNDLPPVGWGKK